MMKYLWSHFRSPFFLWNLLISIVVAPVAGHLIVTHGRDEEFKELLNMPGYVRSVVFSGIITFILFWFVYGVSFSANVKFARFGLSAKWLGYQLVYGVGVTLGLELVLATVLYGLMGFWILETAFFDKIFLPVVLFVLLLNACYLLYYSQKIKIVVVISPEPEVEVVAPVAENDAGESEGERSALLYISEKRLWQMDMEGKTTFWFKSLDASMEEFGTKDYFRCDRNWMVHRGAIVDVKDIAGRIRVEYRVPVPKHLKISRRNLQLILQWYELGDLQR